MLLSFIEGTVDVGVVVAWIVGATVAITVHEYAHARRALAAGDKTPEANGRVTINPLAHYDPVGTTLFLFAGFGWAKPVPVNPTSFSDRRRDGLMVALWGPLSNILAAAAFA
ncbi:MAG: site-2 protease family protein, partial [Armatimonadota bacterium]